MAEAVRQRRSQRAGRSLAGALIMGAFFAAIGYLLDFHPGIIVANVPFQPDFLQPVLMVIGVATFALAALFGTAAFAVARPHAPWGDSVPGACPVCGNLSLREGEAVVTRPDGIVSAAIILCDIPRCPYSAASLPS
jgi:hypothetical protein